MRQAIALFGFALAAHVGQGSVPIPDRPNFTGSWTLVHAAADPRLRFASGPDYLLGSKMEVVQDATRLAVTLTSPEIHPQISFTFDGSESRNSLPGLHGGPPLQCVSRLTWNRDTLIVETTEPWAMTQRWSLTPSGQLSIQDVAPNLKVSVATTHLLYARK